MKQLKPREYSAHGSALFGNARRRATLALVAGGITGMALIVGCSSRFSPCKENRTCAPEGEGGDTGTSGQPGNSPSEGGASSPAGGSDNAGADTGASEAGGAAIGTGGDGPLTPGGSPSDSGSGGEPSDGGAGIGGTGGSGGTGGTGTPDVTAPTVLSVTPTNNAKGVAADASVVVTWSEPMDKATAQASFQCPDLAGKVTFDWTSATVMKVVPVSPLVYAEGKHEDLASIPAKTYTITLNTSAKDQAGNALVASYAFKFSTLRSLRWTSKAYTNGNSFVLSSKGTARSGDIDTGIYVGDLEDNSWQRLALQFDISGIPVGAVAVSSASLSVFMSGSGSILGKPFAVLGSVLVDHIATAKIDATTLLAERLRSAGTLVTTTTIEGVKTTDTTPAVADDLAKRVQRGNRSQFRVQFSSTTNSDGKDDGVYFLYDSNPTLSVDYLIP